MAKAKTKFRKHQKKKTNFAHKRTAKGKNTITSNQSMRVVPVNRGIFPKSIQVRLPCSMAFYDAVGVASGYFDIEFNNWRPFNPTAAGTRAPVAGNGWTTGGGGSRSISTTAYTAFTNIINSTGVYKNWLVSAVEVKYGMDLSGAGVVEMACIPFIAAYATPGSDIEIIKQQPYSKSVRVDSASGTAREHTLKAFYRVKDMNGMSKEQWRINKLNSSDNSNQQGTYYGGMGGSVVIPNVMHQVRFAYNTVSNVALAANVFQVQVDIEAYFEFFNPEYTVSKVS